MDTMISRHATRLLKLRVDEIEVKARISDEDNVVRHSPRSLVERPSPARGPSAMLSQSLTSLRGKRESRDKLLRKKRWITVLRSER